jgi:hypothetical protein
MTGFLTHRGMIMGTERSGIPSIGRTWPATIFQKGNRRHSTWAVYRNNAWAVYQNISTPKGVHTALGLCTET